MEKEKTEEWDFCHKGTEAVHLSSLCVTKSLSVLELLAWKDSSFWEWGLSYQPDLNAKADVGIKSEKMFLKVPYKL